jgi:hypothetical protein
MTPGSPILAELRPLLEALCEETITPEQLARLEELVLAHPEAEAYYIQFMSFHADLIRTVAGFPERVEQSVRERTSAPAEPVRPADSVSRPSRLSRAQWLTWAAIVMAAGLLAVLLFMPRRLSDPRGPEQASEPTDETVAVLLQTHRAQWEETGMPTRPGAPLQPGRLLLQSGFAHIEFYSGATVILEGPADFRLISRNEGFCASGKLRATVPATAHGFRIGSPTLDLIDRGTEFGLDVGGAKTAVHVFQGRVDLYDPASAASAAPRKELTTGQGVSLEGAGVLSAIAANSRAFLTASEMADRSKKETERRQQAWAEASASFRKDPALRLYYAFQDDSPWGRTLSDVSRGREQPHDGAVVGCAWGEGRWRGRQGLEFKRVSDRVRLNVPGEFRSITLAAWVRPDALPNVNHSLLMADGWDTGKFHWQIGSDGTLILGIKGPRDYHPAPNVRGPQYRAPGAITPEQFGRWVHLAVVYDADAGEVVHYMDGRPVAQSEILLELPLRLGNAELGNWNPAGYGTRSPIRNFNGCVDEFWMFDRALTGPEVDRLYTLGRPPL